MAKSLKSKSKIKLRARGKRPVAAKAKVQKKGLKKKRGSTSIAAIVSTASNAANLTHIPPHIPLGPYTVVRGRTVIPFTTNFTGQNTVFVFGQYGLISQYNSVTTPIIAINGVGINVPGTTETQTQDQVMSVYDSTGVNNALANASLHALSVNCACVSSATSATGVVYYGAVNQRLNRGQFATYNAMALSALTRREMSSISAYNCMNKPIEMSAYPVDLVDWASQKPFVQPNAAVLLDNSASDSLSQMVIIFPPTAAAVEYIITIHSEWRVNFTDPALASTSTKHTPTPSGVWDGVMKIGSDLGGKFQLMEAANTVQQVSGAIGSMVNTYNMFNPAGGLGLGFIPKIFGS